MPEREVAMPVLRILFLLIFLVPLPALAEGEAPVSEADRQAMTAVIADQMAAFRRDDGEAAFAFAAPEIQLQFGTPKAFMTMVRRGYAPVYRPHSVEFKPPRREGGRIVVPVIVGTGEGRLTRALYLMRQLPDGEWRIAGCVLEELPELGA